jgi:hypothetical protein
MIWMGILGLFPMSRPIGGRSGKVGSGSSVSCCFGVVGSKKTRIICSIGQSFAGAECWSLSDCVIRCPFWRPTRAHFGVEVCDNLVDGVPHCVASHFYPDDPFSYDDIEDYYKIKICPHFVWTDFYSVDTKVKSECFFGGICVHPAVRGFSACKSCSRFRQNCIP